MCMCVVYRCVLICGSGHMHLLTSSVYMHNDIKLDSYFQVYVCVYIYIYIYTHMCVYIYIYTHTSTRPYIYIYIYTHTHKHKGRFLPRGLGIDLAP